MKQVSCMHNPMLKETLRLMSCICARHVPTIDPGRSAQQELAANILVAPHFLSAAAACASRCMTDCPAYRPASLCISTTAVGASGCCSM